MRFRPKCVDYTGRALEVVADDHDRRLGHAELSSLPNQKPRRRQWKANVPRQRTPSTSAAISGLESTDDRRWQTFDSCSGYSSNESVSSTSDEGESRSSGEAIEESSSPQEDDNRNEGESEVHVEDYDEKAILRLLGPAVHPSDCALRPIARQPSVDLFLESIYASVKGMKLGPSMSEQGRPHPMTPQLLDAFHSDRDVSRMDLFCKTKRPIFLFDGPDDSHASSLDNDQESDVHCRTSEFEATHSSKAISSDLFYKTMNILWLNEGGRMAQEGHGSILTCEEDSTSEWSAYILQSLTKPSPFLRHDPWFLPGERSNKIYESPVDPDCLSAVAAVRVCLGQYVPPRATKQLPILSTPKSHHYPGLTISGAKLSFKPKFYYDACFEPQPSDNTTSNLELASSGCFSGVWLSKKTKEWAMLRKILQSHRIVERQRTRHITPSPVLKEDHKKSKEYPFVSFADHPIRIDFSLPERNLLAEKPSKRAIGQEGEGKCSPLCAPKLLKRLSPSISLLSRDAVSKKKDGEKPERAFMEVLLRTESLRLPCQSLDRMGHGFHSQESLNPFDLCFDGRTDNNERDDSSSLCHILTPSLPIRNDMPLPKRVGGRESSSQLQGQKGQTQIPSTISTFFSSAIQSSRSCTVSLLSQANGKNMGSQLRHVSTPANVANARTLGEIMSPLNVADSLFIPEQLKHHKPPSLSQRKWRCKGEESIGLSFSERANLSPALLDVARKFVSSKDNSNESDALLIRSRGYPADCWFVEGSSCSALDMHPSNPLAAAAKLASSDVSSKALELAQSFRLNAIARAQEEAARDLLLTGSRMKKNAKGRNVYVGFISNQVVDQKTYESRYMSMLARTRELQLRSKRSSPASIVSVPSPLILPSSSPLISSSGRGLPVAEVVTRLFQRSLILSEIHIITPLRSSQQKSAGSQLPHLALLRTKKHPDLGSQRRRRGRARSKPNNVLPSSGEKRCRLASQTKNETNLPCTSIAPMFCRFSFKRDSKERRSHDDIETSQRDHVPSESALVDAMDHLGKESIQVRGELLHLLAKAREVAIEDEAFLAELAIVGGGNCSPPMLTPLPSISTEKEAFKENAGRNSSTSAVPKGISQKRQEKSAKKKKKKNKKRKEQRASDNGVRVDDDKPVDGQPAKKRKRKQKRKEKKRSKRSRSKSSDSCDNEKKRRAGESKVVTAVKPIPFSTHANISTKPKNGMGVPSRHSNVAMASCPVEATPVVVRPPACNQRDGLSEETEHHGVKVAVNIESHDRDIPIMTIKSSRSHFALQDSDVSSMLREQAVSGDRTSSGSVGVAHIGGGDGTLNGLYLTEDADQSTYPSGASTDDESTVKKRGFSREKTAPITICLEKSDTDIPITVIKKPRPTDGPPKDHVSDEVAGKSNYACDTSTSDAPNFARPPAVAVPSFAVGLTPVATKGEEGRHDKAQKALDDKSIVERAESLEIVPKSSSNLDGSGEPHKDGKSVNHEDHIRTKPLVILTSEHFLETSSESIAELNSGRWSGSFFAEQGMTHKQSIDTLATRKITVCDVPLVDPLNIGIPDVELPDSSAVIVVHLSSWQKNSTNEQSNAKIFIRKAVQLAATGRYKSMHFLLCADVEITASISNSFSSLQNALVQSGCPTQSVTFQFVSPRALSASIAHRVLNGPVAPTWIEEFALDSNVQEEARFLLSLVPTLSVYDALHCLHNYSTASEHSMGSLHQLMIDANNMSRNHFLAAVRDKAPSLSKISAMQLFLALNIKLSGRI